MENNIIDFHCDQNIYQRILSLNYRNYMAGSSAGAGCAPPDRNPP